VPAPKIESIAVLPLENLSGDKEQEYFADGMTDALITNLGKISALRVISRTSVMRYKQTKKPLPEIARELKVDAVVEGSVLRSGERVRISANLLHAPSDRQLWANSYESQLQDVLVLQGEVARAIAEEVRLKLTPQEQTRLTTTRPVNPKAYEAYLKGRYFWNKGTEEALRKSVEYFQQAIGIDPDYALPHAGLADAYVLQVRWNFLPPKEASPMARAAAKKALEIDDTLAEAHISMGGSATIDWDYQGAEREFRRAIELNPNSAMAHGEYGGLLVVMGQGEEGVAELHRAQELDPLSHAEKAVTGWGLYMTRQYDQAMEQEQNTLEMEPNCVPAHLFLGPIYEQRGEYEKATRVLLTATTLSGGSPEALASLGHVFAVSGNKTEARKILHRLRDQSGGKYVSSHDVAVIYVGLGDKEQAFSWLEKAFAERDQGLSSLKVNPRLDPLRSDPRFQDLLRRMNFPPQKR
jgi:TolB-like protein/Flp pilus assembly protein TadD